MDFRKFLEMVSEKDLTEAKKKKPDADGDGVPDWADKKPGEDDHAEAKKEKKDKKKSLKDWFEQLDKELINEAEQITIQPAKQNTQVIKQGTKTLGTVSNPQLAAQIKQSIGKGEMSLAGTEIKEEELDEKWAGDAKVKPTGEYKDKSKEELKSMLAKLHKSGPHDKDSPAAKKMRQINFALRAKGGWKSGEGAAMKEEQLDEKAVSKKQQKFMGMVHAAQKGEKPASAEVAKVAKSMKKGDVKDFAQTKHKGLPEKKKKVKEADIPPNDSLASPMVGAPLGTKGKSLDSINSKIFKKVNESMQHNVKAAYQEGYAHGLREQPCRVKHYTDMEEAKQYFEGYKCGLDECYGMGKTAVIGETPSMPQSVPAMANAALPSVPAMEADMEEGNAFTAALAKADKGEKFTVGGKTFTDRSNYDAKIDEFAFESLDKQLNDLLNEDAEVVNEGLSVNMSKGMGGMGEDTVSVSASGDDASKLLDFIKQVGLGGLGGAEGAHGEPAAAVVSVSDYGAPKYSGHDGMADLMKKVSGDEGADDYKLEKPDHEHSDSCGCKVDEVETPDQMLYNVAEDDGEGYEQSQAAGAEIDSALAGAMGGDDVKVSEGGDGGEASEEPVMSEESKSEEDQHAEKAGKEVAKDIEHDEGHKGKDDDKAEKAGEKVTKDIEYDDKKDEKEKVDEWANDAGKKGTDAAFEEDINFMTKVISGGLNKPKATGQTTVPVIPGQDARIGESMDDAEVVQWKRLAGLA